MAKVIWTEPALRDLGRIYDYVATQSQSFDTADRICNELLAASERLSSFAAAGNLVPEGQQYGAREIYKHSYRIIYVVRGDACYVVRCIHGSRDLARQLDPNDWPAIG
jgi:plasmid stabilization system protein ParE